MIGVIHKKKDKWFVRFDRGPYTITQLPVYSEDIELADRIGSGFKVGFYIVETSDTNKSCRIVRKIK